MCVVVHLLTNFCSVQALFKARAVDPKSSDLLTRIVDFGIKVEKFKSGDCPAVVKEVIDAELPTLLNNHKSVADYVAATAADTMTNLPTRVAVANALMLVKKAFAEDAAKLILEGGLDGRGVNVETCRQALAALKSLGATDAVGKWTAAVMERFPLLKDF